MTEAPSWKSYSMEFRAAAERYGASDVYIRQCLDYAEPHIRNKRPVIYDAKHLSLLVGYSTNFLYTVSNSPRKFYRRFRLQKRSGGQRQIDEPLPSLKEVQRWIHAFILSKAEVPQHVKSYQAGMSIRTGARFHRNQCSVLRVDLRDFFGSITVTMVARVFRRMGYSPQVAALLAGICTLHKTLPQGAPTSPSLSNIVVPEMDARLARLASSMHLRYTRYADDLSISGDFKPGKVIAAVTRIVTGYGFRVNRKKTRVMRPHQRQLVTGLVVNEKVQVPRALRRELRLRTHYIQRFGLTEHLRALGVDDPRYVQRLVGTASYILSVNPHDEATRACLRTLRGL